MFELVNSMYPQDIKEDLTEKYKNLLLRKLEHCISWHPSNKEKYLENYSKTLKIMKCVSHYSLNTNINYSIYGKYDDQHFINSEVTLYVRSNGNVQTTFNVFAGFSCNPIGQVRRQYTISPFAILDDPHGVLLHMMELMVEAKESSNAAITAYCNYVKETGDLS